MQGLQALEQAQAATGSLSGGGTQKAIQQYAQGLASTNYQQAYNNALTTYQTNRQNTLSGLLSLTGLGQTATGQSNAALQNYGNTAAGNVANAALYTGNAQQGAAQYTGNALQGAANFSGNSTIGAANNSANALLGTTQLSNNYMLGGANALAGGTLASANAINSAIGGVSGAVNSGYQGYQLSQLMGQGAPSYGGGVYGATPSQLNEAYGAAGSFVG